MWDARDRFLSPQLPRVFTSILLQDCIALLYWSLEQASNFSPAHQRNVTLMVKSSLIRKLRDTAKRPSITVK